MTTSTEIVRVGALALDPTQSDWTERQQAALVQLGVQGATAGDQAVFLHQCQRTGLDPFTKQIYMIGRKDGRSGEIKWTIQTGIDGFRVVAERPRQGKPSPYIGQDGPYWCGDDGVWRDVWLKKAPPLAAKVGIKRSDWPEPIYAVAHFHEYAQSTTYNGQTQLTKMWREKGAVMIAKCAEALAFRRAFPQDLSGIYTDEEMSRADEVVRVESERTDTPSAAPTPAATTAPPVSAGVDWDAELRKAAGNLDALKVLWHKAGAVDPENDVLARRIRDAVRVAKADAETEPVDAEIVEDKTQPAPTADVTNAKPAANDAQLTAIATTLGEHGVTDRDLRLSFVSLLIGDRITTTRQLTKAEASGLLDDIKKLVEAGSIQDTINAARAAITEQEAA
ncbi:MAG TPA: phage recombination protein Bet [Actinokineospora sp.]|jgi:phage recombination protein Bet|nr:phage recombination protein Bet [Actinokineospora sp.]